jgi:sporulation protein YlmC with PRC-barrel domain
MRASELLASEIVTTAGTRLGPVRDIRVSRDGLRLLGLVVGGGPFARLAHGWGYAEGRAQGPWLLQAITRRATRRARFVPIGRVVEWGPGQILITGEASDLPTLAHELRR